MFWVGFYFSLDVVGVGFLLYSHSFVTPNDSSVDDEQSWDQT